MMTRITCLWGSFSWQIKSWCLHGVFSFFYNLLKWWSIYTKFLQTVAVEMLVQNISTKYGCWLKKEKGCLLCNTACIQSGEYEAETYLRCNDRDWSFW